MAEVSQNQWNGVLAEGTLEWIIGVGWRENIGRGQADKMAVGSLHRDHTPIL